MAFNGFLQIDGIKGESTDKDHKDWIEILSYSHSIAPAGPAVGAAPGQVANHDIVITKHVDSSSPKLYEAASSGKHIPTVSIDLMRASGGTPVKYLNIKMDNVIISKMSASVSVGADTPNENITFNYGSIKWTYTQQKSADGSGGGNVTGGWDISKNKDS